MLSIIKYGDPILRKKVDKIVDFTSISKAAEEMFLTMYSESGIGLAANQVGLNIDLLVLDASSIEGEEESIPYIFINSEIIEENGSMIYEEGCLSFPGIRVEIKRPETIKLRYQDLKENYHEKSFKGIISRVIQHELDHLQGILFIDHLPMLKQKMVKKRLAKLAREAA